MSDDILNRAHAKSTNNFADIIRSDKCGCYYCLKIFSAQEILEWVDTVIDSSKKGLEPTAVCPYCKIDSVLGSFSGFPIDMVFLSRMNEKYFKTGGTL